MQIIASVCRLLTHEMHKHANHYKVCKHKTTHKQRRKTTGRDVKLHTHAHSRGNEMMYESF